MAPDRRQSSGRRDRARARFQRCLKCQLCEERVKVFLNTCVKPRRSAHVAIRTKCGWAFPTRSPGYSQLWQFLDSTGGGAHRADPEIHRTCEETGVGRGGVRSVGTRMEGRMREGVVGGRRTSVEIALRGRSSHGPSSRFSDGDATSPTAFCGGASSTTSARFRISDGRSRQTPAETKRFHAFLCRGGHRVDFRSAGRHSRGDREGQCGRGGQVVEPCGPSSDEFATSPHFHGGAICPSARDFFRCSHGKLGDSVIGRSARTVAKYGHRGHRVGEASHPGPPKSLLRRRGPFAIPGMRGMWFPESNGLRR